MRSLIRALICAVPIVLCAIGCAPVPTHLLMDLSYPKSMDPSLSANPQIRVISQFADSRATRASGFLLERNEASGFEIIATTAPSRWAADALVAELCSRGVPAEVGTELSGSRTIAIRSITFSGVQAAQAIRLEIVFDLFASGRLFASFEASGYGRPSEQRSAWSVNSYLEALRLGITESMTDALDAALEQAIPEISRLLETKQ